MVFETILRERFEKEGWLGVVLSDGSYDRISKRTPKFYNHK